MPEQLFPMRLKRITAESDGSFLVGLPALSGRQAIVHVETTPIGFGDDRTARAIWVVAP